MRPCNTSDPNQRWTFASDRAVSPSADSQLCLTRNAAAAATPLFVTKCRGSAGEQLIIGAQLLAQDKDLVPIRIRIISY